MLVENSAKPGSRPSRRQRRLLWAGGLLAVAVAGLTAAGFALSRKSKPAEYRPGEETEDITRSLERGSERGGPAQVPARAADLLNTLDRRLPAGAPFPAFRDVTASAGLAGFRTFAGDRTSQLPEDMGGGAAWGDFDNDGLEDLFLVSAGGPMDAPGASRAPSRLYRNMGGGTLRLVEDFPETRILGMGAAWGDYNRDGWLDLVVTGYDTILLFRNERGRLVRERALPSPKGFWTGAAWGDFDRDGDLDLYVCGYVRYAPAPPGAPRTARQFGLEVPYTLNPSSYPPERNLLFVNHGKAGFREAAQSLGVANPDGRSLSALWHDFDGDGWIDLYVANDVSESKFYRNVKGKLVDAGAAAWVSEYRGSMGLAAGDWDRDGDDDLFISHWIAQQFALYNSLWSDQKLNRGGPPQLRFMDVAESAGVGQPTLRSIGWGAEFGDFDSDGWPDLAVAAGSTFEDERDRRKLVPMEPFLFWNQKGRFFQNLAPWSKALAAPHVSRGLAVADYDRDGALDIAIVDLDGGVRLLRNEIAQGNWVELKLPGLVGGATAVASAGGVKLRRSAAGASYLSQSSRTLHFGLGDSRRLDSLEVTWPDGSTSTYGILDANALYELRQGDPAPRRAAEARPAEPPRERVMEFWNKQRAAMDAIKKDGDVVRAAELFRQALAIDPAHEDSRYYLANCLAAQGDTRGALSELDALTVANPQSHRGWLRRAVLLAQSSTGRAGLRDAAESAGRALRLNPEETGAVLLLGELALAMKDSKAASDRFRMACLTNPRAVGGFYLRGYLAWIEGDAAHARELLLQAQRARGPEWKPRGSVHEGDVARRMHSEATLLSQFWETWDGTPEPANAFAGLKRHLEGRR